MISGRFFFAFLKLQTLQNDCFDVTIAFQIDQHILIRIVDHVQTDFSTIFPDFNRGEGYFETSHVSRR